MTKHRIGNWVDRGEPAERHLARVLTRFLELNPATEDDQLSDYARTIVAFVAADGSEVELADYLASLQRELRRDVSPGRIRRYVAIALWHIAKAGLMRDARNASAAAASADSESTSLSPWLSERLLRRDAE
jgi:hypothetical protein